MTRYDSPRDCINSTSLWVVVLVITILPLKLGGTEGAKAAPKKKKAAKVTSKKKAVSKKAKAGDEDTAEASSDEAEAE